MTVSCYKKTRNRSFSGFESRIIRGRNYSSEGEVEERRIMRRSEARLQRNERPPSRSATVVGLSKSETQALFHRACQVFMTKQDQRSFDAVYQVPLLSVIHFACKTL